MPHYIKTGYWDLKARAPKEWLDLENLIVTSALPSQTGNAGKFLTTDGSNASWATIPPDVNIYTTDGSLTGNRTVTMGSYSLSFTKDLLVNGIKVGIGNIGNATYFNTVLGYQALNTSGNKYNNTAIGALSMFSNANGSYNVAVGNETLYAMTGGTENVAIGDLAAMDVTTGYNNTGVGAYSLQYTTTGFNNTAIGYLSNCYYPSGSYNTVIGAWNTIGNNLGGANNTVLGARIVAFGNYSNNIIIGDGAGNMRLVFNSSGDAVLGGSTTYPTFAGYKLDVLGTSAFRDNVYIPTASKYLFIGTDQSVNAFGHLIRAVGTTDASIGIFRNQASSSPSKLEFFRSRGTYLVPTANSNNDQLSDITSFGWATNSTNYVNATRIRAVAESIGLTGIRGRLDFYTYSDTGSNYINISLKNIAASPAGGASTIVANDASSITGQGTLHIRGVDTTSANNSLYIEGSTTTQLLKLSNDGQLLVGTGAFAGYRLDVNGTARVSGATALAGVVAVNSTNVSTGYALFVNGFIGATGLTLTDELTVGENFSIKNNGSQTIQIDANNNDTTAFFRVTTNANAVELFRVNEAGNFLLGTTTEIASAKLVVTSTTQGFLPPRMTTAQKNAIATPATGLMVYDTTLNKVCVYTGATWETMTSA
jgi:hypothetical protein